MEKLQFRTGNGHTEVQKIARIGVERFLQFHFLDLSPIITLTLSLLTKLERFQLLETSANEGVI